MMSAHEKMQWEVNRQKLKNLIERNRKFDEMTSQYDAGEITFAEYERWYKQDVGEE